MLLEKYRNIKNKIEKYMNIKKKKQELIWFNKTKLYRGSPKADNFDTTVNNLRLFSDL